MLSIFRLIDVDSIEFHGSDNNEGLLLLFGAREPTIATYEVTGTASGGAVQLVNGRTIDRFRQYFVYPSLDRSRTHALGIGFDGKAYFEVFNEDARTFEMLGSTAFATDISHSAGVAIPLRIRLKCA